MSPHEGHDHDHAPENPQTATRPFDPDAPVFDEPWQAQALALAEALKARGLFSATEWAEALGAQRARQQAEGTPDTNQAYFEAVIAALEHLAPRSGIAATDLDARRHAWEAAYARTPHGKPVELEPAAVRSAAPAGPD